VTGGRAAVLGEARLRGCPVVAPHEAVRRLAVRILGTGEDLRPLRRRLVVRHLLDVRDVVDVPEPQTRSEAVAGEDPRVVHVVHVAVVAGGAGAPGGDGDAPVGQTRRGGRGPRAGRPGGRGGGRGPGPPPRR